ncbi:hypothetical protein HQ590_12095, partial [bacterium]|nr:hypothetical protein [bacterium]
MTGAQSTTDSAPHRVRLAGTVIGVPACECVSDQARIVVGSSRGSDLCLADPLVPRRAFIIRREPGPCWTIEAAPGARVYVNDRLIRRERLAFTDAIAVGCHRLVFGPAADRPRNFRSTTAVGDLYPPLLARAVIPSGFLRGTPQWLARRRLRTAATGAAALLLAMLVLIWLTPRPVMFEQVQPPLEVVMVAEQAMSPDPNAVRSLNEVDRRTLETPTESTPPELAAREPAPVIPPAAPETAAMPELADLQAPAPVRQTVVSAAGSLAPLNVDDSGGARLAVTRPARKIERTAPARRLSIREITDPVFARELATHQIQLNPEALRAVAAVR